MTPSPLVTSWPSLTATTGNRIETTWPAWFTQLTTPALLALRVDPRAGREVPDKTQLPGWSAALFHGDRRTNAACEAVTAIVLDYDGGTALDQAVDLWRSYDGFVHTTPSHQLEPGVDRFRVILPLQRPVTAPEHAQLWQWAHTQTQTAGHTIDEATKDPARLWFLPAALPDAPFETRVLRGTPLDPDTILPSNGRTHRTAHASTPLDAAHSTRHYEAALTELVHEVRTTQEGHRNRILNRNALRAFRLALREDQSLEAPCTALHEAALAAGLPEPEVRSTLASAERAAYAAGPAPAPKARPRLGLTNGRKQTEPTPRERASTDPRSAGSEAHAALKTKLHAMEVEEAIEPTVDTSPRTFQRPRDDTGTLAKVTAGDLARELIIVYGNQHYLLRASGEYSRPLNPYELRLCWFDELVWAENAGLSEREKDVVTESGTPRRTRKKMSEILDEYATVAQNGASASLVAQCSYYDPATESFTEAICRRRRIQPAFDSHIDQWLRFLGGNHADALLDWIATLPDLSRPTSILLLTGPKGAGKSMLAEGLARLWSCAGPARLKKILGNFNSGLADCPLVFSDEGIPRVAGQSVTSELREIFAASSFTLSRKYLADVPVRGALRCIVASNRDAVFDFGEELTEDDAEAIGARFLHVPVPRQRVTEPDGTPRETSLATEYLLALGGRDATADWVDGDRIASHALWLVETRTVVLGKRFLVEGQSHDLVSKVAISNGTPSDLCEWIVKAILHTDRWRDPTYDLHEFLVRKQGCLYVAADLFSQETRWERYIQRKNSLPTATAAGRALSAIAHPGTYRKVVPTALHRRFRKIRLDRLLTWVATSGLGDADTIQDWISQDSPQPTPQATAAEPLN
jgi:hypothetical protein